MWKQEKLYAQLNEISHIKDFVVISGGLAWHLMSPPHEEQKMLHDHKDVDLFVIPRHAQEVFSIIKQRGFNRYWTKYDRFASSKNFIRYGKNTLVVQKNVKILLDLFIREVPFQMIGKFKVMKPEDLLPLYNLTLMSSKSTAVQAAYVLVKRGIDPIGRPELIGEKHGSRKNTSL